MIKNCTYTALIVFTLFAACGHKTKEGGESHAQLSVAVEVASVVVADMPVTIVAPGMTDVIRKEKIVTPVNGVVASLKAVNGSSFAKGDVMAAIRPRESQAAVLGAQALKRAAHTDAQKAEAQRALELAESTQYVVEVRAKFNGVVTGRNVVQGEIVAENAELFTLIDPTTLYFNADVPVSMLPHVRPKQRADIQFRPSPAKVFSAECEAVDPIGDSASQTVSVRFRFTSLSKTERAALTANMRGTASILIDTHKNAVIVPRRALLHDDENDAWSVVVAGADSLSHNVNVTVGVLTDTVAEITGGSLRPGEHVIVRGNYGLPDSTHITVQGTAPR
jgi:RND family efflux transporter MFP subunit